MAEFATIATIFIKILKLVSSKERHSSSALIHYTSLLSDFHFS
jgi:hypothetical protein